MALRRARTFLGADVDHEVVGRIGRQAALPVAQQVVTHQREQQQHHEAEAEGHDLHDAVAAAAGDVHEAIAPGDTHAAAQRRKQFHQHPARDGEQQERRAEPARHVAHELRITHDPVQQREHGADRQAVDHGIAQRRRLQVAAQDARRRNALQAQQRRQREADEHDDSSDGTQQEGISRRWRQVAAQQVPQQPGNAGLRHVTDRRAGNGRHDGDCDELDHRLRQHEPLRRAHALHQRDGVEVATCVALRCHRHCDG
jgi:hypothetical protein